MEMARQSFNRQEKPTVGFDNLFDSAVAPVEKRYRILPAEISENDNRDPAPNIAIGERVGLGTI
jgi:hypothetical protein